VSSYFFKQTIFYTWNRTNEDYLYLGSFTKDPKENAIYIPDPNPDMCQGVGVRHGYPWVPTDQAHGRPRQVSSAYQKTRRPVSGPNWPSWQPTRPPEDLPEDSSDDLIQHDLKTWRTRQDIGGFWLSRSTGYGKRCNLDLGLLVVTDQESRNRPHPLANIRRARRPLVLIRNPQAIYTDN
jgi:hypothetical protein